MENTLAASPDVTSSPRISRVLSNAGWGAFALLSFTFFTLYNLPQDKIKNTILGKINLALAPRGLSMTAERGGLSLGFGVSYIFQNVTLTFPDPDTPSTHFESLRVSPAFGQLLQGRLGAVMEMKQGTGSLQLSVAARNSNTAIQFSALSLDAGKIGILPLAAGIQGGFLLSGKGALNLDMDQLNTSQGKIDLDLKNIQINSQTFMGFTVPKLVVSAGKATVEIDKGHLSIKTLQLGKPGVSTDDIQATVTGDLNLGKTWDLSTFNLKARFSLSQNILKAFALIDALLTAGKRPDGSYGYQISGPLGSPQYLPLTGS